MGNTGVKDRSQQLSLDDAGPTLLHGHGFFGRTATEEESSPGRGLDEDGSEFLHSSNLSPLEDVVTRRLPSVIKWEGGGHTVFVSFDDGSTKIPMVKSQNNFYTIINLPEGTHRYKFLVDGQWKCDPKEPKVGSDASNLSNTLLVKGSDFEVFEALAVDSIGTESAKYGVSGSPPGSYTQNIPQKYSNPNPASPPTLPPQLLQVILNTETPLQCEPTLLPEPNHVMLNHLYALSIKDGVMVMSGTHRYRKKYVTTLLYKPT